MFAITITDDLWFHLSWIFVVLAVTGLVVWRIEVRVDAAGLDLHGRKGIRIE